MVRRRPSVSAQNAPDMAPNGVPGVITKVYAKDRVIVRPCCRKNCGSQVTKPKIRVLMVMSAQLPTIIRGRRTGDNRDARLKPVAVAGAAGAGNGPAASASMDRIKA